MTYTVASGTNDILVLRFRLGLLRFRFRLGLLHLRFRLGLGSVLPRLRGDCDAINGGPSVALGAGVGVPAAPVAGLPLLGFGLLDEPLQLLDCRRVHLDHAP